LLQKESVSTESGNPDGPESESEARWAPACEVVPGT
jgi:hypothetical protein